MRSVGRGPALPTCLGLRKGKGGGGRACEVGQGEGGQVDAAVDATGAEGGAPVPAEVAGCLPQEVEVRQRSRLLQQACPSPHAPGIAGTRRDAEGAGRRQGEVCVRRPFVGEQEDEAEGAEKTMREWRDWKGSEGGDRE